MIAVSGKGWNQSVITVIELELFSDLSKAHLSTIKVACKPVYYRLDLFIWDFRRSTRWFSVTYGRAGVARECEGKVVSR